VTPILITFGLALIGGTTAYWLNVPLAWLIGPLITIGMARIAGMNLKTPSGGLQIGQSTVGVAVGLQMTSPVVFFLYQEIGLILTAGSVTVLLGWPMAVLLQRLAQEDIKTCYFAAVPGGLSEMAVLGSRYGAQVEPIAIAQTMRLAMIVVVVPPVMALSGITGDSLMASSGADFLSWLNTALLIAVAVAVSAVLSRFKVSNAWLLGGVLTGCSIAVASKMVLGMHALVIHAAQFFLGIGLGVMFNRNFVTRAPRFIRSAAVIMVVMLGLAWAGAALVSHYTEHDFGTMMLSFAPAGVTEMVLTAKALGFEAPLITAIHLTRILFIVMFAVLLFRLTIEEKAPPSQ